MANLEITANDTSSIVMENALYEDGLLTLAGKTTTGTIVLANTVLARDSGTKKFVLYVQAGNTTGNGIAKGILLYPVTGTVSGGDVQVRVLISGTVRASKIVFNDTTKSLNTLDRDSLRGVGIIPQDVNELGKADNS